MRILCIAKHGSWAQPLTGFVLPPESACPVRGRIYETPGLQRERLFDFYNIPALGSRNWISTAFVPVRETDTDISVFLEILDRHPSAPRRRVLEHDNPTDA